MFAPICGLIKFPASAIRIVKFQLEAQTMPDKCLAQVNRTAEWILTIQQTHE